METVLAVVALLFVLSLLTAGYVTVKAVGAAKRRVDGTLLQARRTVEDSALRTRARIQPGPAGELAELRLRLRSSLRATRAALDAHAGEDASLKESLGLFDRLDRHGRELDDDLKRLEAEPDRAALAARLPDLRDRTDRITASADALRWAAVDRARRFADDDLDVLGAQIDTEADALRHWSSSTQGPTPTGRSQPDEAAAADGGARRDQPRPEITHGPRKWTTFPWQQKTRPENTT